MQQVSQTFGVLRNYRERRRRQQSLRQKLNAGDALLHLGCGDDHFPDFVNIDQRRTQASDLVMNLSAPKLPPNSARFVFSNAFFEHLYRNDRGAHLQRIRTILSERGSCCYIGLPYFPNIARFYLEGQKGTVGPVFDLYNVYRYTHGDPEHQPEWWLGQLHKSLFDYYELRTLIEQADFKTWSVFTYSYPFDECELPVCVGFYASTFERSETELQTECLSFLERLADSKIRLQTLEWITEARLSEVKIRVRAGES